MFSRGRYCVSEHLDKSNHRRITAKNPQTAAPKIHLDHLFIYVLPKNIKCYSWQLYTIILQEMSENKVSL